MWGVCRPCNVYIAICPTELASFVDPSSAFPFAASPQNNPMQHCMNNMNSMLQMFQMFQQQQQASRGHSSLGAGATRFSQVSPTMMGNASNKFRLADQPSTASSSDMKPGMDIKMTAVPASDVRLASDVGSEGEQSVGCDANDDDVDEVDGGDKVGGVRAGDVDDEEVVDVTPKDKPAMSHVIVPVAKTSTAIVDMTDRAAPQSLLARLEAEMLLAHKSRDTKRGKYKEAVKGAETSKTPVAPLLALPAASDAPVIMRRPSSSSVLKRPASAARSDPLLSHVEGVDMTDVFTKLRLEKGPISRGAFTSRAHDVAKNRAKKHVSMEEASQFARYHYKQASILYDELKLNAPVKRAKH